MMKLPFRAFFPYALPGLLAFFGLWWFSTRKKNHAGKQDKHASVKEEESAAVKSSLVEEIDSNTHDSLSNRGDRRKVSLPWDEHIKPALPVETVGVLDQSRLSSSFSSVSTEDPAFQKEETLTMESALYPDTENVCLEETEYPLITEKKHCNVTEIICESFGPLQVAHHLTLNEQDHNSVLESLDPEKLYSSVALQEEVFIAATHTVDYKNFQEIPESENALCSTGTSEVLHTVVNEREQSSAVEMAEVEKGIESSISLHQQTLYLVSANEGQSGHHELLQSDACLHSCSPLLQEAAYYPLLEEQKHGSVPQLLESEKAGQFHRLLKVSLQHSTGDDQEQGSILKSGNLKHIPLHQSAASQLQQGLSGNFGLSNLQKPVQTSFALQDASRIILNEQRKNNVPEFPDSEKNLCTSTVLHQKSLRLAEDREQEHSASFESLGSENILPSPCLLFQEAAYHDCNLELTSAFQSESENTLPPSEALHEQASCRILVAAQVQRNCLELVESESNYPSPCSLQKMSHRAVHVSELSASEKNGQSCSPLQQEATYSIIATEKDQSCVELLASYETEHSPRIFQQDGSLCTEPSNQAEAESLKLDPEAALHPSLSLQVTVQRTLSEKEQNTVSQSVVAEENLQSELPLQHVVQDTLNEQEKSRISELSGPEKMFPLAVPLHVEAIHHALLTEEAETASAEMLELENHFCSLSPLELIADTKNAPLCSLELSDCSEAAQEMGAKSSNTLAEKTENENAVPTVLCPVAEAGPESGPENEAEAALLAFPCFEKVTGLDVCESSADPGEIAAEKRLMAPIEAGSHKSLETEFSLDTYATCNEPCAENVKFPKTDENITLEMVIENSATRTVNCVASELVSKVIEAAIHEVLSSTVEHKTEMHPIKSDMKIEQVVCRPEIGEVNNVLHEKTSALVSVGDLKAELDNLMPDHLAAKALLNESEEWQQNKMVTVKSSGNEYSNETYMKNHSPEFSVHHRLHEMGQYCVETVKDLPESTSLIAEDSGCSTCTSEDGMCSEDILQNTHLPSVLAGVLGESIIKDVLNVQNVVPSTIKQAVTARVEQNTSYSKDDDARNSVASSEGQWFEEVDNLGGSDVNSMHSGDSGCGFSSPEHHPSQQRSLHSSKSEFTVWEIEVPKHLVGRLIGKQGRYVSYLKQISGAKIYITTVHYTQEFQICHIEGSQQQVDKALSLIGEKFRELDLINIYAPQRPVTLPSLPVTSWLSLPEGVTVEVIVVNIISAGHVFVQQHTHPTFHALQCLNHQMRLCYSQPGIPAMPAPVAGVICAAPAVDGAWWRAQVVAYYKESNEADIRYVDYGGYEKVKLETLRQIRSDFVTLPFQGVEVLLDNIVPLPGEDQFSSEADAVLVEMTRGCSLLAQVTNYESSSGLPLIQLWNIMRDEVMSVNRTLVERGLTHWIDGY